MGHTAYCKYINTWYIIEIDFNVNNWYRLTLLLYQAKVCGQLFMNDVCVSKRIKWRALFIVAQFRDFFFHVLKHVFTSVLCISHFLYRRYLLFVIRNVILKRTQLVCVSVTFKLLNITWISQFVFWGSLLKESIQVLRLRPRTDLNT